ncbi:MAG: 30S ribosomal protein S6 [Candidatus Shapirobacteria bacterium]|nr:30S ribosomal protein S6 [Candidatus Shapirobacteria bacterium]
MKGNKHQYQIILVLSLKTEDKEKVLNKAYSWLESRKAEISNKDHMGIKDLAYEIEDNTKGDFWVLDVDSKESLKVKEFNLLLDRETNIIRYLILKK